MDQQSHGRLRRYWLIVVAILLLGVPSGAGIILLRQSASVSQIATSAVDSGDTTATISDEVFESVLSRPTATTGNVSPAVSAADEADSRIKVMLDGTPFPVANGGTVALGDELQLTLFVEPYPPSSFEADVDMYLTSSDATPVNGAEFDILYDMLFMNHGPFRAIPQESGDGHYSASYDFSMFGSWVLDTYVAVPDQEKSVSLQVAIYVWPR